MADEVTTTDTDDVTEDNASGTTEHQTVKRLPPERTVGPYFPSGMSDVEAAIAGATAGMSDDDIASVQDHAKNLGLGEDSSATDAQPLTDHVNEIGSGSSDSDDDGGDGPGGRPGSQAPKDEWVEYRESQGHDVEGLTVQQLKDLPDTPA